MNSRLPVCALVLSLCAFVDADIAVNEYFQNDSVKMFLVAITLLLLFITCSICTCILLDECFDKSPPPRQRTPQPSVMTRPSQPTASPMTMNQQNYAPMMNTPPPMSPPMAAGYGAQQWGALPAQSMPPNRGVPYYYGPQPPMQGMPQPQQMMYPYPYGAPTQGVQPQGMPPQQMTHPYGALQLPQGAPLQARPSHNPVQPWNVVPPHQALARQPTVVTQPETVTLTDDVAVSKNSQTSKVTSNKKAPKPDAKPAKTGSKDGPAAAKVNSPLEPQDTPPSDN